MPTTDPAKFIETALGVAHVDQYFGVWAILEQPFRAIVERFDGLDLAEHVARNAASDELTRQAETGLLMAPGGVAVIDLSGPLMKYASSLSGGTSTVAARRKIRLATASDDVTAILLRVDSPGGTAAGTKELADDIAAAAKQKPCDAYIEDMGASAAFWAASQARHVYCNATALAGSIGTYMAIQDLSGAAARLGVKVHVVRAGTFKGAGTPGTEITADQLAEWQRVIDDLNEHFVRGVAAGRKMTLSQTRELSDGRVHVGAAAQSLGLVDGVQTFDETLSNLRPKSRRSAKTMSAEITAPEAASYQELTAACVGAAPDFICSQLDAKATVAQAVAAWMKTQKEEVAQAKKEAEEAKAELAEEKKKPKAGAEPPPKKPGQRTLGSGSAAPAAAAEASGDPIAAFDAAVRERMAAGATRQAAIFAVHKADPELHKQFLLATNPGRRRQELLEDKFELI